MNKKELFDKHYFKFLKKVETLPPPGKGYGYHTGMLGVAYHGVRCIPKDEVFGHLRAIADRGTRHVEDSEINQAVEKAWNELQDELVNGKKRFAKKKINKTLPKKGLNPEDQIIKLTKKLTLSEEEFTELSPIKIPSPYTRKNEQAQILLDALFKKNDILFIGARKSHARPGKEIRKVPLWIEHFERQDNEVPFIIPNPLSGHKAPSKAGNPSYRCDAAILEGRYAVIESDNVSSNLQLALLAHLPLPIAAIVFSGGRSYHAWIDLQKACALQIGLSLKQWNHVVIEHLKPILCSFGADPSCFNISRLSRLAGIYRKEKKSYQRLIYLNRNPAVRKILR